LCATVDFTYVIPDENYDWYELKFGYSAVVQNIPLHHDFNGGPLKSFSTRLICYISNILGTNSLNSADVPLSNRQKQSKQAL